MGIFSKFETGAESTGILGAFFVLEPPFRVSGKTLVRQCQAEVHRPGPADWMPVTGINALFPLPKTLDNGPVPCKFTLPLFPGLISWLGGFHFLPMSHLFFTMLAQAAAATGSTTGGFNPTPFIYMICIFAIFYFLAIRPQSQRQKQLEALIKSVKTGDKIVTSSGIHGMVSNVKETTLIVKIADNVKIELEKSSVASVVKRAEDDSAS